MNINIGALYKLAPQTPPDVTTFMVSVEGKGWMFYSLDSLLMVIDKNVQVSREEQNLINVRVLLPDGLIGIYWNPERLRLAEKP